MFAYIMGNVEYKNDNYLVLDNNGIGYEINVSTHTSRSLVGTGEPVKVYTYMHFVENGVSIYGFSTMEEKDLFMKLISVSGVGPKAALNLLSGLNMSELSVAIAMEDIKLISNVKGIGRKTAERIILELHDKVSVLGATDVPMETVDTPAVDDAINVLVSLGVSKNEALKLARQNAKENSTAEEIIALSLRGLNS